MKLEPNKISMYGAFSITPDEGWTVGSVFVDFKTKLLIVHGSSFLGADAKPSAWARRVTTIDVDSDEPRVIPRRRAAKPDRLLCAPRDSAALRPSAS